MNLFKLTLDQTRPNSIRIDIPYSNNGYKFSVEFKHDILDVRNNKGSLNLNIGNKVDMEPKNALLVFANPMPSKESGDLPPDINEDIYYPTDGSNIDNLDSITNKIIYFKPGTYYMSSNHHVKLTSNVQWIYFAAGSYVKGAFEFQSGQKQIKITGDGILSGEKYVYETDKNNDYKHTIKEPCWGSCLKMLQFYATDGGLSQLTIHGLTLTDQPYHTFVIYGDRPDENFNVAMDVNNYKQLGSWYWQTDGLELYNGSTLQNSFLHSNDDVIKLYHNDLNIKNIVVWKGENGPVIQFGWKPRNLNNINVDGVDVIHNRMFWNTVKFNTCLINSAKWDNDTQNHADTNSWIKNIQLNNILAEGMVNCAIRIYAFSNIESMSINNLNIERWNELNLFAKLSKLTVLKDQNNQYVQLNNSGDMKAINIESYIVQNTLISKKAGNWKSFQLGKLNFDYKLINYWNIQ